MGGSSDPLMVVNAQKNPLIMKFIIIVLIFAVIMLAIHFILRHIHKIHTSREWNEAQKNKDTTAQNVINVAKKSGLTKEERDLLWDICQKFKAKNIEYLIKDADEMTQLMHREFESIKDGPEAEKTLFFQLNSKLERERYKSMVISTTGSLEQGQEFSYKDADGNDWKFTLSQNTQQGMQLEVPVTFINSNKNPAPLTKIILIFNAKNEVCYSIVTRVIRYAQDKEGNNIMIVSASNQIKQVLRRVAKRMAINIPCKFAAAKPKSSKKNTDYEIQDKRFNGRFVDISAAGCRIECTMPIKQGQNIYLEFSLENSNNIQKVIGTIIATKKARMNNNYILHIQFENLNIATKNKIYALIHGFIEGAK